MLQLIGGHECFLALICNFHFSIFILQFAIPVFCPDLSRRFGKASAVPAATGAWRVHGNGDDNTLECGAYE